MSLASEKLIINGTSEENSFLKLSFGKLYCWKLSSVRQSGNKLKSMQTFHPDVHEFIALYRALLIRRETLPTMGVMEIIFPVTLGRLLGMTDGKELKMLSNELKREIIRLLGKQMKHSCLLTNKPSHSTVTCGSQTVFSTLKTPPDLLSESLTNSEKRVACSLHFPYTDSIINKIPNWIPLNLQYLTRGLTTFVNMCGLVNNPKGRMVKTKHFVSPLITQEKPKYV